MEYTESPPPPALAAIVRCVWTLEGSRSDLDAEMQPVLPDGCPELIVHLGDAFERVHEDGRAERQPAVIMAGQLTSQLTLRPTGRMAVVGVRFHPDGAGALVHESQHALAGLTIGMDQVSPVMNRALVEVVETTDSPARAARAITDQLAARADLTRIDPRIRQAVELITRRRGHVSIARLATHLGLTRRHLERRFKTLVGISPKRLARIARFHDALRVLGGLAESQRGTQTAMTCGYADQAHFIREFRELAGCPPGEHLLRDAQLAGFFAGQ